MPIAVIALDLDPFLRLGDLAVRWQTVALAILLTAAIGVAGVIGRRARFRVDDLLYILVGAVPGAVIGGRIGYAIIAPEAFAGGPLALADPAIGGLELGLGVAGGVASGTVVAAFLGAPVRWWADRLAVVLVLVLAGGKAAMALGGSGQGALSDATWATAYLGAGPWGTVAADLPSHPAQLYEALGAVAVAIAVAVAASTGAFRDRDGSRLFVAIAGWAGVRALVSVTWRDPASIGPLPNGGVLALVIALGALLGLAAVALWLPRRSARGHGVEPSWPDPGSRPRF